MSRTASRMPVVQYGVIPWRRMPDGLQILLVTTRNTRRWIVPKGWPEEGRTPQECAAREGYEEAGVKGALTDKTVGVFSHKKQLKSGQMVTCRIHVYGMEVNDIADEWPEKSAREIKWCPVDEALVLADDSGLRRIIAKFSRTTLTTHQAA